MSDSWKRKLDAYSRRALASATDRGFDITIRGSEERSLRKSVDTYTVLGPYLVTADEVGSPDDLDLSLSPGRGAQLGRNLHGDGHQAATSCRCSNADSKLSRSGSISCMWKLSRAASSVFSPSPVM